jgi:hypothetical protein
LYSIEENGQTALGPAMLFTLNLLENASAGSKIILCTDEMANIGVSAVEGVNNPEEVEKIKSFYKELGVKAKLKGIIA